MFISGRVRVLDTAKRQFGLAGENELFGFLEAIEQNCEAFSRDYDRAVTKEIKDNQIALILPYHEVRYFVGAYARKDNHGIITPFGSQNWVHIGNLACELHRPPITHSDHHRIKMRRFFPRRPDLAEAFLEKMAAADEQENYIKDLSTYLQAVRFNNV